MALKLSRHAGTVIYGGRALNAQDLEQSFDHKLWVRMVRHSHEQDALINVSIKDAGVEEHVLRVGGELQLEEDIVVGLEHVKHYTMRQTPYCTYCKRGGEEKKIIPQASFTFRAPREYNIIRDDAQHKR